MEISKPWTVGWLCILDVAALASVGWYFQASPGLWDASKYNFLEHGICTIHVEIDIVSHFSQATQKTNSFCDTSLPPLPVRFAGPEFWFAFGALQGSSRYKIGCSRQPSFRYIEVWSVPHCHLAFIFNGKNRWKQKSIWFWALDVRAKLKAPEFPNKSSKWLQLQYSRLKLMSPIL